MPPRPTCTSAKTCAIEARNGWTGKAILAAYWIPSLYHPKLNLPLSLAFPRQTGTLAVDHEPRGKRDLPMSFIQELKRRNVFRVAITYGAIGWLLVEIASVLFPTFEAPAWVMKVFATIIILGFPLALFLSWAFELTPDGIKKEKDVDRSQSITAQTGRKIDAG